MNRKRAAKMERALHRCECRRAWFQHRQRYAAHWSAGRRSLLEAATAYGCFGYNAEQAAAAFREAFPTIAMAYG